MIRKVWNFISNIVVIGVVLFAILLVGVRLIGLTPFTVLSGSMEPKYPVGSLIYVKNVEPESIVVGDAITFVLNENLVIATHEVYEIDKANMNFYTQGIANIDDQGKIIKDGSPVHFNNLVGKPIFSIPYLGYISSYVTTKPGMYIAGSIGLAFILLMFIPDLIKEDDNSNQKKEKLKATNT